MSSQIRCRNHPTASIRLPMELWPWVVEVSRRDKVSQMDLVAAAQAVHPELSRTEAVRLFLIDYFSDNGIGEIAATTHESLGEMISFGIVLVKVTERIGWAVEWLTIGRGSKVRGFFRTRAEAQAQVDILTGLEGARQTDAAAERGLSPA